MSTLDYFVEQGKAFGYKGEVLKYFAMSKLAKAKQEEEEKKAEKKRELEEQKAEKKRLGELEEKKAEKMHLGELEENKRMIELEEKRLIAEERKMHRERDMEEPLLLLEESVDGIVFRLQLCVITEGSHNIIYVRPYDFTDPSRYKPGEFKVDDLSNITRDDLHGDPNCTSVFLPQGEGLFVANWIDCIDTVNGRHPTYADTYTCDGATDVVPAGAGETPTRVPYVFKHIGPRFTLKDVPDNYVSPCEKQ